MNGVMNKTQLADKRYRGKLKNDKKYRFFNKKRKKNKIKRLENMTKTIKSIIINYKKQKHNRNSKEKAI